MVHSSFTVSRMLKMRDSPQCILSKITEVKPANSSCFEPMSSASWHLGAAMASMAFRCHASCDTLWLGSDWFIQSNQSGEPVRGSGALPRSKKWWDVKVPGIFRFWMDELRWTSKSNTIGTKRCISLCFCFGAMWFCFSPTGMVECNSLWHGHFTTNSPLQIWLHWSVWVFGSPLFWWLSNQKNTPLEETSKQPTHWPTASDSGAQARTIGCGRAGIGIRRPGWISRFRFRFYMISSWNVPGSSGCLVHHGVSGVYTWYDDIDIFSFGAAEQLCVQYAKHGATCITTGFA